MLINKLSRFDIAQECTIYISGELPEYIELRNAAGKVFYFRYLDKKEQSVKININKPGEYYANFTAEATIEPISIFQPVKALPQKERDLRRDIKIQETDLQQTPARMFAMFGIIQYDREKFKELPLPCKVFILLHEIGHFFYVTEWKTDLFALYHFCKLGYNPSNAFYTLSMLLDTNKEQGEQRVKNLYNVILYQQNLI